MDVYKIVEYPMSTEKAIRLMESENKLVFTVAMQARKPEIKAAIEKMFNVKVEKVTTHITPKGQKRAYVRLAPENPALDIATDLGLM
jgi:large subunit ribosomal protein L23